MEHRYADESGPSWYTGRRYTTDPEVSGSHALGEGAYHRPEQREAPPEGVRVPVRGPEYPAVRPTTVPPQGPPGLPPQSPAAEPTALVPPVTPLEGPPAAQRDPLAVQRGPDGSRRIRRPVSALVLAATVVVLLLPALRLLLSVTFAADATAGGIVPAVLLALGLALTAFGLFAAGGDPLTRDAWLRAPLVYLPAGLIVLLAAGLAVA